MTVAVPSTDTVEVGRLNREVRALPPARPGLSRQVYARVSQGISLVYPGGRVAPQVPVALSDPPRVWQQKLATFPPFYRTYVFVAPPDLGKVVTGYTGGDLNRLKFVGRSGL